MTTTSSYIPRTGKLRGTLIGCGRIRIEERPV
jgi:hypothetical protein